MTVDHPPASQPDGPRDPLAGLPADLENALYDACLEAGTDERTVRFDELLEAHPEHAEALRRAQRGLLRSEQLLGHLQSELSEASQAQFVGPFEVLRVLGEGGFGTVYLAQQHEPVHRQVALKVLHQSQTDDRSRRRFAAERQLLARLQHRNIAQVFDAGVTDDHQHYIAMEFVDGEPITDWCRRTGADLRARLELFQKVCAAVQHAHQREVVHRDLKPSNVLVHEEDGGARAKVIDFGIAKLIAPDDPATPATSQLAEPTVAGAQVGTPGYMSPEQAAGDWVDTRTDVYSLGVLLCELLTGTTPIEPQLLRGRSFVAIARAMAENSPRRPSAIADRSDPTLLRQLREDLDWVVLKAVATERDERYATVAALSEDVARFLDHEPVHARRTATGYVLRKFVQRHRLAVALGLAGALTIVAVLLGLTWGLGVVGDARADAERGRQLAEKRGAAARMAVAQLALDNGDTEAAREYLHSVPAPRRHWGWRHLASRIDQSERTIEADETYVDVAWLDEQRVLAFPLWGDIACWNVDTGEQDYVFDGWRDTCYEVLVDTDLGLAVVAGAREISLWHVHTGDRLRTLHRAPEETLAMAWSEDRTLLALSGKGGWLDLVPIDLVPIDPVPIERDDEPRGAAAAAAAVPSKVRHQLDGNVTALAFLGTGELVLGMAQGELRRFKIADGETVATMPGHTDEVEHLLLDVDRDRIYSGSVDATLRVWDLSAGAPRARITTDVRMRRLALNDDGSLLYAGGGWSDHRLAVWRTDTLELAGRYSGHRRGVQGIALSEDGQRLVSSARDGTLRVWPGAPIAEVVRLEAGSDARKLAATADGSRFGTASWSGRITVWDAATLEPVLLLETDQNWSGCVLHGGHVYVVGSQLRAYRIADGALVAEGPQPAHGVESMLAVQETDRLFGLRGEELMVWQLSDLALLHTVPLPAPTGRISWDAVKGRPVIGDHQSTLRQLDPRDGRLLDARRLQEADTWTGGLACHGEQRVVGSGRQLRFEREGRAPILVQAETTSAAFSPDGRRIATGGPDHKVRLWDPETGDQLLVLDGLPYNVTGVRFVDGGRRIVALSHRWYAPNAVFVWTAPEVAELDR